MEATALSVGKSVLNGALSYAKSAMAEEVALQLGVQRDQAFITDELDMMQSFLMVAHEEGDGNNKVVKTWVKQVRDVAYNVEDSLQDFAVRVEKQSWWRIPRTLLDRRDVAKEMKELRAKVEDVSQRNMRYNLIKGSSSKPASLGGRSTIACETISSIDEARRQRDNAKMDLIRLINNKDDGLRVIAVWGTTADELGETSIIKRAYEDIKMRKKFKCTAWIRLMQPFDSTEFLQNIIKQFHVNFLQEANESKKATLGPQALRRMGMMKGDELADEFKTYVKERSYLVVLNDLHTIEEWNCLRTYFPDNKKGSRILVSTEQVGVASLCVGPNDASPEHKQLSHDQTLYAFYNKGSQDGVDSTQAGSSSNAATTGNTISADNKRLTRTETIIAAFRESTLIGRQKEKSRIIELTNKGSKQLEVISLWGMGGLGKTTLVRDIYQNQELSAKFEKRACVTIMRPFNPAVLLKNLAEQFIDKNGDRNVTDLSTLLDGKKYLIVLDDLSSTTEWDSIIAHFPAMGTASRILVTTRVENIAMHCSKNRENIFNLQSLDDKDAHDLFTLKVFNQIVELAEEYPDLVEQAQLILKKCKGLPLAIVTIGSFLANQSKTALEWQRLNQYISAELEMNPELETIITVLNKSFDGLPYHLKPCFLYLPIFPEDCNISRRRLVRRWTAEGYSREMRGKSAEETAGDYFMELISRSMILPYRQSNHSIRGIDSCQVHDLIREIAISKSMEENLVFRLEEGGSSNCQGTTRHLVVSSNWDGDKSEFEGTVDLSRIRSFTVFGEWKQFYISDKMKLLRVLDLEGASDLFDHHLVHIGKLLHLKYLSLRGCVCIHYLPKSVGNLRQLKTLDIKGTSIVKLPRTIIKLRKLNHFLAGSIGGRNSDYDDKDTYHGTLEAMPKLMRNNVVPLVIGSSMASCVACCAPIRWVKEYTEIDGDWNRRDLCTALCCAAIPGWQMRQVPDHPHGVALPREIYKLKVLRSLSLVNIWREKGALQDINRLTWLRKLGVTGINKRNCEKFCSAIAGHSRLESLLVRSEGKPGLYGCLDSLSSPPPNLQSLKLYGNLVTLPEWIHGLGNLVKLKLRSSMILEVHAAIQVLEKLPNLSILCLGYSSFNGEEVHLSFHPGAFRSLVVLELVCIDNLRSVKFEEEATPKLGLLQFTAGWNLRPGAGVYPHRPMAGLFSGLPSLPNLEEFLLCNEHYCTKDFSEDLRCQLAMHPKRPVLKMQYSY